MKLKDLSEGQKFQFVNDIGKTWKKISDNGDIATYNTCICLDDLHPDIKLGLMIIPTWLKKKMNKDAEVVIV